MDQIRDDRGEIYNEYKDEDDGSSDLVALCYRR